MIIVPQTIGARHMNIYLDGEPVRLVEMADTDAGMVRVVARNGDGTFVRDTLRQRLARVERSGVVTVKLKRDAPAAIRALYPTFPLEDQ